VFIIFKFEAAAGRPEAEDCVCEAEPRLEKAASRQEGAERPLGPARRRDGLEIWAVAAPRAAPRRAPHSLCTAQRSGRSAHSLDAARYTTALP
jgi:hypothetical protein